MSDKFGASDFDNTFKSEIGRVNYKLKTRINKNEEMNLDETHLLLIQDPANIHRRELFVPEGMTVNPRKDLEKLDSNLRK